MRPKLHRLDGPALCHVQGLFDMQSTRLAVHPYPSIVIDPIGDVGILLYFRNNDSLADGV